MRVEVAIPVERYLVTHGYVTRLEEDKLGNDVLKLTEAGEMKLGI